MKPSASHDLRLPPQLQSDYDMTEQAREVHARWQTKSLADVRQETPDLRVHEAGEQSIRYADLTDTRNEPDPDKTIIMSMPVGKEWGPEAYLVARVAQEVVAPDSRMLVFPNNNRGQVNYTLSKPERKRVASGDFSPFSERQVRACAELGVTSVALVMGRSMGAVLGASFGNVASDSMQLGATLLDEAPNTYPDGRSSFQLRKSVSREQRQLIPAFRNSGLPAYIEAVHAEEPWRFYAGLARFVIGGNFQNPNPAVNAGFRHENFYEDVTNMLAAGGASMYATNASESTVSSAEDVAAFVHTHNPAMADPVMQHAMYDGYHVTAGNPMVMGLLARRALQWHDEARRTRLEPDHQAATLVDMDRHENPATTDQKRSGQ